MGSLFGGGDTTTTTNTSTSPWGPQGNALQNAFNNATDVYSQRQSSGPYTGSYYSPINSMQQTSANNAYNYATGTGSNLANTAASTAAGQLDAAPSYQSNANSIYSNGVGTANAGLMNTLSGYGTGALTTQGASSGLSSALNSAATTGANSIGSYLGNLGSISSQALSDPTQRIANDAGTYMNSSAVQSALSSTNQGIQDVLNEQTVPGLNREASMGGNLNSSRAGMAEALANKSAATAQGTADASILNNAYNSGLSTASGLYSSGLTAATNANSNGASAANVAALGTANQQQGLSEFNTQNQMNAANSGLSQQLNFGQANANTQLAANSQLGNAVSQGYSGAATAGNLAGNNYNLGSTAGGLYQTDANSQLANQYQQWNMNNTYDQNILNDYDNIVGRQSYGSTGTSTQDSQNSGSVLGGLLSLGLTGASLFGSGGLFGSGSALNGLFGSGTSAITSIPPTAAAASAMRGGLAVGGGVTSY